MELAIVILQAASLVFLGFAIVVQVRNINRLNAQVDRLNRLAAHIERKEMEREMRSICEGFEPTQTTLTFQLVNEDEAPLDFPNDRAKKGE